MQFKITLPDNPLRTFFKVVWKYRFNPGMWPTICRLTFRGLRGVLMPAARLRRMTEYACYLEDENRASIDWCVERAITIEELEERLPFPFTLTYTERKFSEIFRQSRKRIEDYPERYGGPGDMRGNLDLLYSVAESVGAQRIVETGVAYGWSSLVLLLAVNGKDDGYVYSTDLPYLSLLDDTDNWVGIAVPDSLRSRWRLFAMADREGLPRALRSAKTVDLAHYDSDKTPEGRAFGYDIIWKHLKKGGVLMSDDIGDNLEFKRFSEKVERTPIVVECVVVSTPKYQGVLIK